MASPLLPVADGGSRKRARPDAETDRRYADASFPSSDCRSLFQEMPLAQQLDHHLSSASGSDSSRQKHSRIDVLEEDQWISSFQHVSAEALVLEAVGFQSDSCLAAYEAFSPNFSHCGVDALEELVSLAYQSLPSVPDNEKPTYVAESCYLEDINCVSKDWEEDVNDAITNIYDVSGCDRQHEIVSNSLDYMENSSDLIGQKWRDEVEDNWLFDALQLHCNGDGSYPEVLDVE